MHKNEENFRAALELFNNREYDAAAQYFSEDLVWHYPCRNPLQGVYHGIRGMVQRLVEQYAEHYGAFPTVIATGGDAQVLFGNDELVERIVPELTLMGIAAAARYALAEET